MFVYCLCVSCGQPHPIPPPPPYTPPVSTGAADPGRSNDDGGATPNGQTVANDELASTASVPGKDAAGEEEGEGRGDGTADDGSGEGVQDVGDGVGGRVAGEVTAVTGEDAAEEESARGDPEVCTHALTQFKFVEACKLEQL